LTVDLARCLQPVLLLERDQRLPGLRTKFAVDFNAEAVSDQHLLHLAYLFDAEVHGAAAARGDRAAAAAVELRARRADRNHRDDPVSVVDDHDLVAHHEILVAAPFRMDTDQHIRNLHDAHAGRHRGAHAHREVDVVNPRHVRLRENLLANLGALLGRQLDATLLAAGLALPALLGLARLALLLASLVRLRLSLPALFALALTGGAAVGLLLALLRFALLGRL